MGAGSGSCLAKPVATNLDQQGFLAPRCLALEEANVSITAAQGLAAKSPGLVAGIAAGPAAAQTMARGMLSARSAVPALGAVVLPPAVPPTVGGHCFQHALG